MACMLRGLWIFHAESDVRLVTSRRFPTVERKMQRLLGDDYVALPSDEDINIMFITEVLHEEEEHFIPPGIPEPFHEDFSQGSFAWDAKQEAYAEKLWPMGPICSISKGKIWPLLFMFKKGFYLVTVVALERKYKVEQVRSLELPQITAAFAVLEDICDFIPAQLTIADVAGISELQYYIRSAIPFGSPTNTNYHLLRMVRHGFPNKGEEETRQRSPAWKPYLYKGKQKLRLSIVETVHCMLYGKAEYEDDCFIAGTIYCCADVSGIPEIILPISYSGDQASAKPARPPDFSVHNCAHIVDDVRGGKSADSLKISCTPPTGPFVLCRYRYATSPIIPVRGFYQLKEMSPVEFRLLLQVQFHPIVTAAFWSCQVRLPFHHRGVIKSHDLKCSGGSFSVTDQGHSILWNLNVRRSRSHLETNLLGEIIFEASQADNANINTAPVVGTTGGGSGVSSNTRMYGELGSDSSLTGPLPIKCAGAPQLSVGGTLMVNRSGNAVIVGSSLTPSGGLMYANPSSVSSAAISSRQSDQEARQHFASRDRSRPATASADAGSSGDVRVGTSDAGPSRSGDGGSGGAAASSSGGAAGDGGARDAPAQDSSSMKPAATAHPVGRVQDPFLRGVNCYAEVFLEVPDITLSGIKIDPKAITVYPTTRTHRGVAVQKEVHTGKYVIWNMVGEVRGHRNGLAFDEEPAAAESGANLGGASGTSAAAAGGSGSGDGSLPTPVSGLLPPAEPAGVGA
eukprot:TRINITY_DN15258_c0_g1_i2.p1 TRINITY_DN15258_c0_g1~~TRINITY_DN15258_c0_g1_i2.p1  ORF type:complete len:739 (+),score=148.48 TRINITY_DN15258_c0_g1_i2:277-2493(+)